MRGRSKQSCVDCHFLMKQSNPHKFGATDRDREAIKNQDYSPFTHMSLGCYFGVWDEGYNFATERRHEVIVETNRKNYCFFWKYRPGMLFPAAEVLQKREADNQEAARDRKLTLIGLFIAAVALVVNALLEVARIIGLIK